MLLEYATGESEKGISTDKVTVFSQAHVTEFHNKDKEDGDGTVLTPFKYPYIVYKNKSDFDKRIASVVNTRKGPLEEV